MRHEQEQEQNQKGYQEGTNLMDEMYANSTLGTDTPSAAQPTIEAAVDNRVWKDAEGNEVSKSAFIREQFLTFNLSRKQIAEQFDIPYRTVYGATVNMTNEAEPATRGRGVVNSKIQITGDNKVALKEGDKYFLNGEEVEAAVALSMATSEVDRNTWIKEQVAAGVNRGDIAKYLGLSYGVIYGLTKEAEGTRSKHMVTLDDGTEVSRSEYIRQQVAAGKSKADVAKELNVEYSIVWQATKEQKTVAEKLADAIATLEKFQDNVVEATEFADVIATLKVVTIKAEPIAAPQA